MKLTNTLKTTAAAVGLATLASTAFAQTTTLRIQTHNSSESTYGENIAKFVENVETMSGGDIDIEMFYSAAVVKPNDTFDAARNNILDCDMTNGSYQTGKNPAFQFVADTLGGYDTPMQYLSWVYLGGGKEAINDLYGEYDMHYIGAHLGGQESLNSTSPLRGPEDLVDWKFRSPPGMQSEIFANLGASPIVMDFTEIFTALETGIIDGADASTLATNVSLGIYDIAKHTTYPGFHSMSSDHLACRQDVWDALPDAHKRIIEVADKALAMDLLMDTTLQNGEALGTLPEKGVTIYNWSEEDRATFREAARTAWEDWATRSPEAREMVDAHKAFINRIGLR